MRVLLSAENLVPPYKHDGKPVLGHPVAIEVGTDQSYPPGCRWRLVYSGRSTRYEQPLFWIVKHEDGCETIEDMLCRALPVLATDDHQTRAVRYVTADKTFAEPVKRPGDPGADDHLFWTIVRDGTRQGLYIVENLRTQMRMRFDGRNAQGGKLPFVADHGVYPRVRLIAG